MPEAEGPREARFPCTYPGCARGYAHPMESAKQLANHRFAAHGIRSTNEESIARQQRRDKHRAEDLGAAPEYIDRERIREQVSISLPSPRIARDGELNPGEREYIRRRLSHLISQALPAEIRRNPAEICVAIAEICAAGLTPAYPKVIESQQADVHLERLTQLFTKTAIAAS